MVMRLAGGKVRTGVLMVMAGRLAVLTELVATTWNALLFREVVLRGKVALLR